MRKFVIPVLLIAVWEILALYINAFYFPTLDAIYLQFVQDWPSGQLLLDIRVSLYRLFVGLIISIPLAIIFGSLIGFSKTAQSYCSSSVNAARIIPLAAVVPLVVLVFGINTASVIAMVIMSAIVPTIVITITSISQAVDKYSPLVKNFELPTLTALQKVYFPAASPEIYSGIDLSISMAFRMLIFAECMGVNSGIGYRLIESANYFEYKKVYYLLFVVAIIGAIVGSIVSALRKRALAWM